MVISREMRPRWKKKFKREQSILKEEKKEIVELEEKLKIFQSKSRTFFNMCKFLLSLMFLVIVYAWVDLDLHTGLAGQMD